MSEAKIIALKPKKTRAKKSKPVLEYNRLLKKINKSNKELDELKTELESGLVWVNQHIQPKMSKWNDIRISIAESLFDHVEKDEIDEFLRETLITHVSEILEQVNQTPVLDESPYYSRRESLFSKINQSIMQSIASMPKKDRTKMEKQLKAEFKEMMAMLEQDMRSKGLNIDLSDLPYGSDPAKIKQMIDDRVNVANDRDAQNFDSKPFDLIRKDNSPEASGAVQISEIYRNIVKMVHPDLEQDPAIQHKKSEWMKLITVAYEKRDLSALIQLELQIQNDLGIQLETPSDKKINDYNEALRGILEDKELDTFMLYNNPRYYPLHFYFEPFGGLDAINFSKHALVSDMNDQMNSDQKVLARLTKNKKSREKMIEEIIEDCLDDDLPFDFDLPW